MPSEISQRYISDMLDSCNFDSHIDKDCDLLVILDADSDFAYQVQVYYTVEDNKWLRVWGIAPKFDSHCNNKQKVLEAVNTCNRDQKVVKAYLYSNSNVNRIICERYELIDEYVADDFIKNNCIKMNTGLIWRAFVAIGKSL